MGIAHRHRTAAVHDDEEDSDDEYEEEMLEARDVIAEQERDGYDAKLRFVKTRIK